MQKNTLVSLTVFVQMLLRRREQGDGEKRTDWILDPLCGDALWKTCGCVKTSSWIYCRSSWDWSVQRNSARPQKLAGNMRNVRLQCANLVFLLFSFALFCIVPVPIIPQLCSFNLPMKVALRRWRNLQLHTHTHTKKNRSMNPVHVTDV